MEVKRILFPTDFSDKIEKAIPFLVNMAEKTDSEVFFFHAYKIPQMVTDLPYEAIGSEVKTIENTVFKRLDDLKEKTKGINSNVAIYTIARAGDFISELAKVLDDYKIDLVIMSTKGIEGIVTSIFGTNTEKAIEAIDVPVIVLPQQSIFPAIKNIVFASEYHESDVETIQFLSILAELFDADLTIINVYAENLILERLKTNEFQDMVKEEVKYPKIHFKYLKGDDVYKTIESYVEENNVELVSMTTHHRKLFEKFFQDSVTRKMVKHGNTPILAFH
jgi:nucleotide-binding universal stress UspA family protein